MLSNPRLLILLLCPALFSGCSSAAKKYAPRCTLRNPAIQATVHTRVSRLRSDRGRKPVAWDSALRRAAQKQSNYLALIGSLDHSGRNGGGPLRRLRGMGISRRVVGENIARVKHESNPALPIVQFWTGRPREMANIMNPEFTRMGLAVTSGQKHCYAVLLFSD